MYVAEQKDANAYVVCGSIQCVAQTWTNSGRMSSAILSSMNVIMELPIPIRRSWSFQTEVYSGLTATPERTDGEDLLELFRNVAHKLDLKTAVEMGELSPSAASDQDQCRPLQRKNQRDQVPFTRPGKQALCAGKEPAACRNLPSICQEQEKPLFSAPRSGMRKRSPLFSEKTISPVPQCQANSKPRKEPKFWTGMKMVIFRFYAPVIS
jgi:hypothetical protein